MTRSSNIDGPFSACLRVCDFYVTALRRMKKTWVKENCWPLIGMLGRSILYAHSCVYIVCFSFFFFSLLFCTFSYSLDIPYSLGVLDDGTCSWSLYLPDICSAFTLELSALCWKIWGLSLLCLSPVDPPSLRNIIGSYDAFNASGGLGLHIWSHMWPPGAFTPTSHLSPSQTI